MSTLGFFKKPPYELDEYFESSARTIRWISLSLVIVTFPYDAQNSPIVYTIVVLMAILNGLRYIPKLGRSAFFTSRLNSLAVDHVFAVALIALSGGLASPYYPLFFLLMIATIASYGVAGFALALSAQVIITLALLKIDITPQPAAAEFQFIIKLVLLIIFSLVAEQSVRSRDEEYLLESRFTNQIENERQRLLALINSLSHAVLAVNEKGRVYLYNAAALELMNTNQDISGRKLDDILPLHDKSGKAVAAYSLATKQDRLLNRQDLRYPASDGSNIILDLTIAPVHNFGGQLHGVTGYMLVFQDITRQKSLDEQRDEFISVSSHELRTPMAIAEANLSTALMPNYGTMSEKSRKLIQQAHVNIMFLGEIVQDLTTLSRAERGKLQTEYSIIDVQALLHELRTNYQSSAHAKHLKLNIEISQDIPKVVSSIHELREILQNFITNAIKYTPSGTIIISAKSSHSGVEIAVSDTGIGISASDKTKIFEKFFRSEDYRTRQTGGTGLGLYITKKLADKIGVTIGFHSKLNHGSKFYILVPPNAPK